MGNQNIKIRRVSLTKRNRKISTIGEKLNISRTRDNIEDSSTLINERMKKIEQILFDISQSFPMSTGFERRQLQYSYEIYTREKEELHPLRDNLLELLKQYDITIKIENLSDQINKKISHVAPNTLSPRSAASPPNPSPSPSQLSKSF